MDTFQMECLKDGTWSSKIPTCKSKNTLLAGYKGHEPPALGGCEQSPHGVGGA